MNSHIKDTGTGDLLIEGSDNIWLMQSGGNKVFLNTIDSNAINLYFNNSKKLETTNTGVLVTGTTTSGGLILDDNTSLYSTDATLSKYSSSNGVYLNGNIGGWLRLNGDRTQHQRLDIYGNNGGGYVRLLTNNKNRLDVANNGDISFYDDTGSSQALFWDASAERLGLGTTLPTAPLSIGGTGSLGAISNNYKIATSIDGGFSTTNARQHKVIGFIGTTAGGVDIYDSSYASGERSKNFYSGLFTDNSYFNASSYRIVQGGKSRLTIKQDGEFVINDDSLDRDFRVESDNNTHALFVQGSDGSVGIGTASPARTTVINSSGTTTLQITNDTTGVTTTDGLQIKHYTSGATQIWNYENSYMAFGTNNAERARLDSSGQLLIGKTASDNTTVGTRIDGSGFISSVINGGAAILLNRLSSDGDIALFRKDGSTIGSIGVGSSNKMTIIGTNANLQLGASNAALLNLDTNKFYPQTDNSVDLGFSSSANRFRNLYLTGTANVAGGIQNTQPTNGFGFLNFGDTDDANVGQIGYDHSSNYMRFQVNNTEKARLDSSGNLLVGKTSLTIANAGTEVRNNGQLLVTADGDNPVDFNRLTSDGTIANFRKDSTVVGSIGTQGGVIRVGSGNNNLGFFATRLQPLNSSGVGVDGTIDLGYSTSRFKDLHLSGTINVGDGHTIGNDASDNLLIAGSSGENIIIDSADDIILDSDGGDVIFKDGGVEQARLKLGKFGLGVSSPSAKLEVKSSGSNADEISLVHSGNTVKIASLGQESSHGSLILRNNSGVNQVRLSAGGNNSYLLNSNLGIGTSSPSANLEITQSGNNVGLLVAGGGYNYTAKFESVDAEANIIIEDSNSTNDGNMIGVATNDMYFITDTAERMRIDSSGKVGIGETSPDGKLHIKGGTATGDASHVLFENTQGSKVFAIGGGASGVTNNNLFFRNVTDNTTPMVITDAGSVGIGTTSPSSTLDVESSANTVAEFKSTADIARISLTSVDLSDGASTGYIKAQDGKLTLDADISATGGDPRVSFEIEGNESARINAGGVLYVGTTNGQTSPSNINTKASISGDVYANGIRFNSSTNQDTNTAPTHKLWQDNTDLYIGSTLIETGATSDRRLKENIKNIPNAIEKVKLLNGVTYNYKKKPDVKEAGFIAQDVEKALPEAVYTAYEDGEEVLALKYNRITSVLVEAIKEQQEQIESLKSEIVNLKGE